jgi:hypothetical protein
VPTDVYIYSPPPTEGVEGACRSDLEDAVEEFFGSAAEMTGAGSGSLGFNLDFALADGEDVESWVARLREFLKQANARPGTVFEVFPDGWEPGMAWRRVEVYGTDRWLTKRDPK